MLGSRPVNILMDPVQFDQNLGDALVDLSIYRRLIRKLTVTKPDIIFVVGALSWYV